jgi:RND family efflux transporter MFP subunit
MDLEPVYADQNSSNPGGISQTPSGMVQVSRERQQMIGVRLGRVERSPTTQTLRTFGRVVLEEDRVFPVIAGSDGWVTQILGGTATGNSVRKGQSLVSVYGREYTMAERTFIYALRALEDSPPNVPGNYQDQPSLGLQEARLVLQNMGFGDAQMQRLMKTRQVTLDIALTAPAAGVIITRNVFPRQKFDRGAELFRIADLSHVWIVADLFNNDARYVRSGSTALVSLPDRPGATFPAAVSEALPRFDGESRTLKLRLEAENPDLILRPDMFVDVEFRIHLTEATTVPADAVIESGLRKTVFVDRGEGIFEPRTVETGWRFGGRVQIVRGLHPGESIVVSGNFLLDSESRMREGDAVRHD